MENKLDGKKVYEGSGGSGNHDSSSGFFSGFAAALGLGISVMFSTT